MNTEDSCHILIVEDDPIQCETLRAALEYFGYTCETATTGASALDRFKNRSPDAIVADLGLPDCDGVELISVVRRSSDIPVIVVSGRCAEADKIAALDIGADDYIEKPYLPGELVARLRAKLRYHRSDPIDESNRPYEVSRDTEAHLSRMERALFALLVHHQGETVSEDQIIAAIWGSCARATSADLRTLVLKLRRKLEEQRQPLFVLNERGVGYYVSGWGRFARRTREPAQFPRETPQPARQEANQAMPPFAQDAVQPAVDPSDHIAIRLRSGRSQGE